MKEIMLLDALNQVYEEIGLLIKQKKVVLNELLMTQWSPCIGKLEKGYLRR